MRCDRKSTYQQMFQMQVIIPNETSVLWYVITP